MAQTNTSTAVKNVVLVHGGLVDGSGWMGVYKALKKDGYTVSIVQIPTISLADDVAVTKRAIAGQNGPVILVGHSYGAVVITEALRRSARIDHFRSPKVTHTKNTICPWAREMVSDIIHAEGVRFAVLSSAPQARKLLSSRACAG